MCVINGWLGLTKVDDVNEWLGLLVDDGLTKVDDVTEWLGLLVDDGLKG